MESEDLKGPRLLQTRVADAIAGEIMSGTYEPGEVLPSEHEWGQRFGVSRTALREAMRHLSAKGMIEARPRRGTVVRPREAWTMLDADVLRWYHAVAPIATFIDHVMAVRRIVEPEAAALAAVAISAEQGSSLQQLASVLDRPETQPDVALAADLGFHRLILIASGNPLLAGLAACIEEALRATIAFTVLDKERQRRSDPLWLDAAKHHVLVATAIAGRQPFEARKAMQDLLDLTAQDIANVHRRMSGENA